MTDKTEVNRIVCRAIDAVNELSLDGGLSKDGESVLVGEGGQLNSMGFVNFVVALEEEIEAATGRTLSIAERLGADAPAQRSWTVDQLIELVAGLLAPAPSAPRRAGTDSQA